MTCNSKSSIETFGGGRGGRGGHGGGQRSGHYGGGRWGGRGGHRWGGHYGGGHRWGGYWGGWPYSAPYVYEVPSVYEVPYEVPNYRSETQNWAILLFVLLAIMIIVLMIRK